MPSVKEVRSLIEHHIISSRSCRCKERQDMTFTINGEAILKVVVVVVVYFLWTLSASLIYMNI